MHDGVWACFLQGGANFALMADVAFDQLTPFHCVPMAA